jgi:hypothetical protein
MKKIKLKYWLRVEGSECFGSTDVKRAENANIYFCVLSEYYQKNLMKFGA